MVLSLPRHILLLLGCSTTLSLASAHGQLANQGDVSFNREVRPLLADRCFHCHGPDEHDREGKLRLDQARGEEGAYRSKYGTQGIKPGSPEDSELWYRLTTDDADEVMPPPDSHKKPLSAEERALIKRWIEQGAKYEDFWAFATPVRPPLARVADTSWSTQAIDGYVLHKLEDAGLQPSARADKRTLIRRLSFDLTGLPPTRSEIKSFLDDEAPAAYARLVDRLLATSQYGEHMAKYWLDLVRFADSNGVHHDHYREMTPYRDWVIRAFNANQPYDQFITDQIAGDLHPDPSDEQLTASGFNRLHMIIDRGTALPEESLARNVIDRVTAVGTTFLGLTVHCAVCHDHKYDPTTQKDFYQLAAFFNNLDGAPETNSGAMDKKRGLQPPYISFPSAQQEQALADTGAQVTVAEALVAKLKDDAAKAAEGEDKEALATELKLGQEELGRARSQHNDILFAVPAAMVMREKAEAREAHILIRGDYASPGKRVERNTPAFLPPMRAVVGPTSRMDLAEWFTAPNHPLTARVAVNRFWQQFFGVGLVKTAEDLGASET